MCVCVGGGGCYLYTQREKGRVGGVNFIPRERRRGLMLAFPWMSILVSEFSDIIHSDGVY